MRPSVPTPHCALTVLTVEHKTEARKGEINLDEFNDEENEEVRPQLCFVLILRSCLEQDKSENERGSQASEEQEDYDVDEEYDNDYAENYFDNGEGDDLDNLGDGGGGDEGGGEFSF